MREKEIRVLAVKPHEYPKEFILENSLEAMQEAVGGLIDIIDLEEDTCILLNIKIYFRDSLIYFKFMIQCIRL